MASETHERAVEFVASRLNGTVVAPRGPVHLRVGTKRVRVAGRHIEGRQPNYFHVGPTVDGDPFDALAVVLFNRDWSVKYAYELPLEAVRRH